MHQQNFRHVIRYPDGQLKTTDPHNQSKQITILPFDIRSSDILIRVEFTMQKVRNPSALAYAQGDQWNAEAQKNFFEYVDADTKVYFVNEQHNAALTENTQRSIAALLPLDPLDEPPAE